MKFVSVRELRIRPGRVWDGLKRAGEIVITSGSKPIALLTKIDEETLEREIFAFRQSRASLSLEDMQKSSLAGGLNKLSAEDIQAEIRASRKERKAAKR